MHPKGIDIVQEIGGFCIETGEQYVSIVHYLYNKCTICTVRHKEVGSYDIHAKSYYFRDVRILDEGNSFFLYHVLLEIG